MTWELGCPVCHEGVLTGGDEPHLVASSRDGGLLYRCAVCSTHWTTDGRATWPIPDAQARADFPEVFDR